MKVYKHVKTWVDPETKKRRVVRADSEEELLIKYINARYGSTENKIKTITVNNWFYRAVEEYKSDIKDRTKYNYIKYAEKHVLKYIGNKNVNEVTAEELQGVLNRLKGSSAQLIAQVNQIITFIFKTAAFNGYTDNNPAQYLTRPKSKPKETRRALTDEERAALLQLFNSDMQEYFRIFEIMYYTGARPSEVMELTKNDIIKNKDVYLIHIKGGKTEAAARYIPVNNELINKLLKQDNKYLCYTEAGNPLNNSTYRRKVMRLYREMDILQGAELYRNKIIKSKLKKDFYPYNLRHDYCTRLKIANVDLKTASYIMGHKNVNVTASIYQHVTQKDIARIGQHIINGVGEAPNPWAGIQPIKF